MDTRIRYDVYHNNSDMFVFDFVNEDLIALKDNNEAKCVWVYKTKPKENGYVRKQFIDKYLGKYESVYYKEDCLLAEDLLIYTSHI